MSGMYDYQLSLNDPLNCKSKVSSYLSKMDAKQIHRQVEYIINKGWSPAVEHNEPENTLSYYWYIWKLPIFGETGAELELILAEVQACHKARPTHHVRLIGYNHYQQLQGAAMIVFRGP